MRSTRCAVQNQGITLNLTRATKFKNSGGSSKMTSSCKRPISRTIDFMRLAGTYFHEFQKYLGRYFDQNLYLKSRIRNLRILKLLVIIV